MFVSGTLAGLPSMTRAGLVILTGPRLRMVSARSLLSFIDVEKHDKLGVASLSVRLALIPLCLGIGLCVGDGLVGGDRRLFCCASRA